MMMRIKKMSVDDNEEKKRGREEHEYAEKYTVYIKKDSKRMMNWRQYELVSVSCEYNLVYY